MSEPNGQDSSWAFKGGNFVQFGPMSKSPELVKFGKKR